MPSPPHTVRSLQERSGPGQETHVEVRPPGTRELRESRGGPQGGFRRDSWDTAAFL